jgi:hypothetical protein
MFRRLVYEAGHAREVAKLRANGRRIFLGYSDKEITNAFHDFEARVIPAPPRIYVTEDVYLHPVYRRQSPIRLTGGAFSDGALLDDLALRRGRVGKEEPLMAARNLSDMPRFANKRQVTKIHAAWFGGYLFKHYGHFLLEGLARLTGGEIIKSELPILFFNPTRLQTPESYMLAAFAVLGVDPRRIVLCNRPTEVQTLWVQEPTFQIGGYVNTSVRQRLRTGAPSGLSPSGLVYLSRTQIKKVKTVFEEARLEELLRLHTSAQIIHPEDLTFTEQIAHLSGSDVVSGCEGSAFHSLIFVDGERTSLMLCPRLPNLNFLLCDELIDGDAVYINCGMQGRQSSADKPDKSWLLDVEKAFRVLSNR